MSKCAGHVPIRTCVSCRSKKAKPELIRLVVNGDNRIVIDRLKRANGRGIYICNDSKCMKRFIENRDYGRFFRIDKDIKPGF
jgi:predicted RNA-binding protein YlxR (DUF448 family)